MDTPFLYVPEFLFRAENRARRGPEVYFAVMTSLVPPSKSPSEGPKRGPVLLKRGTKEGPRI